MSKVMVAMRAMWEFAGEMVEKHGMNGDDSMTDQEHRKWQESAGLCAEAHQEAEVLNANEYVTLPAWVVRKLLNGASPHFHDISDAMGKAGIAASEQMQNEFAAIDVAEAGLKTAVIKEPKNQF